MLGWVPIVAVSALLSLSASASAADVIFYAKRTAPSTSHQAEEPSAPPSMPSAPPSMPSAPPSLPPTPVALPPDFPFPPEVGLQCRVERGFIREGATFNDISKTITGSPEECCALCNLDNDCVVWTRHRATGACSLKSNFVEMARNPGFDSGVIGGAPAAQDVPMDLACVAESGVEFMGDTLSEAKTGTSEECCRMCESNINCFSWTWNRTSDGCTLMRSFKGRVPNGNMDGGTIF